METYVDDVEPPPGGGGAAANEVDMGMVKQLMHSHNNLMAEKKQMEDYFEDVEHESQKKNQAISSLQERLAKMKHELDTTKLKAKNARADAEHLDAERKHDDAKRRRRTLPTKPSRNRIKEYAPGEPASVIALDTEGLSRDQLLAEIRSLESDLEFKHQEAARWETALDRLKANQSANARMSADMSNYPSMAADPGEGGGDTSLHEEAAFHDPDHDPDEGLKPTALPTAQRNITDVFADHGNVPAFVSVVEGQLEHIVIGLPELFEQAQFAAQIEAEATELQAALEESDQQSHQLRDMLDEVNHQLEDANAELRELRLMSPGGESMADDLITSPGGHARGESLSDVLSGVGQIDTSIVEQVEEEQRLRAKTERELESARAEARKLKQDNADLQDTITASREVLGMTIEEQMVMIGDQIQVKIELDEANDLVEETKEAMKKVKWEHTMLAEHVKTRDQAVYQLLSASIKARDRKSLLAALQETEYTGASYVAEEMPARGGEIVPPAVLPGLAKAARSPAPAAAEQATGRSSFFGRKTASNNSNNSEPSGATPAKKLERSTSTTSLRSAPPARPFPPGIMHQVKDGSPKSPTSDQGASPDPSGATATSTPAKAVAAHAAAPYVPNTPATLRKLWRDAIEQQIMLNKMEAQLRALT